MTLASQTIHTSGFIGFRNDQISFSIFTGVITVKYPWGLTVDEKSTHLKRLSVGRNGPEIQDKKYHIAINGTILFENHYLGQNPLPFL